MPLALDITPLETVVLYGPAYVLNAFTGLGDDGEPLIAGYGMTIWVRVDEGVTGVRGAASDVMTAFAPSG